MERHDQYYDFIKDNKTVIAKTVSKFYRNNLPWVQRIGIDKDSLHGEAIIILFNIYNSGKRPPKSYIAKTIYGRLFDYMRKADIGPRGKQFLYLRNILVPVPPGQDDFMIDMDNMFAGKLLEIIKLIADGYTKADIALMLNRSQAYVSLKMAEIRSILKDNEYY